MTITGVDDVTGDTIDEEDEGADHENTSNPCYLPPRDAQCRNPWVNVARLR